MYLDWKVGDRVCCINDKWAPCGLWDADCEPRPLVLGKTYEIVAIRADYGIDAFGQIGELVVLVLKGVAHPSGDDVGFDARRFRKVQPRKTSIAIFEAMLHGNRSEVDAG